MNGTVWTISNLLSFARALLAIPIAWLLLVGTEASRMAAAGLIVAAAATDFLDGYFARRFAQVTETGKIIDPAADKIAVGIVVVILTIEGRIPWWFTAGVIARDGLILAGGIHIRKTRGMVLQSNWPGKFAVGILALYIFITVIDGTSLEATGTILLVVSALLLAVSFAMYARRFVAVRREMPA